MEVSQESTEMIEDFNIKFKQFRTSISVKKLKINSQLPKILKTEVLDSANPLQSVSARTRETKRGKNHSKAIKALQIMARKEAPRETMEAMIALLRKGGWRDAESSLPQGWMIRKRTIQRSKNGDYTLCTYLSPQFDFFQSHTKVLAFLQESGGGEEFLAITREENETKLKSRSRAGNVPSFKEATNAFDWQEDETLPPGWKVAYYTPNLGSMKVILEFGYLSSIPRFFQGKLFVKLLSPENKCFASRPQALR